MAEEDLNGLLNIGFASDSEPEEAANPNTTSSNGVTTSTSRADRNALSEADFQALKQSYQAKVENGDIYKTITLPLTQTQNGGVAKPEAQEILHAVEELYFFRRYTEGLDFVQQVLGDDISLCPLDDETKSLLKYYGERCQQRIAGLSRS